MTKNKTQTFFEIVFFFFIGCLFGYVFETILCFFQFGKYESRQGLIYGPFNVIYGIAFVLAPQLLKKKSTGKLFLYSMFYGGIFEYLCSWFQETVFGTISWDYQNQILNFDGRTSIFMMFVWAIIGFVFMKWCFPFLKKIIQKIRPSFYLPVGVLLSFFFLFDILISSLAMIREQERLKNNDPYTVIGEWIDRTYPTEVLDQVYPHRMDPHTLKELRTNRELHQESSSMKNQ